MSKQTDRTLLFRVMMIVAMLALPATACCPAGPSGKPVVNADQTVIILWDAATKTQHFIRQASFKSQADDFGFLVPSPTQPVLDESGNEAFALLRKFTEPDKIKQSRGRGFGCGEVAPPMAAKDSVRVLEEKLVAGFNAAVLEAKSSSALVDWLRDHGYAYSPQIEEWAKPYVEHGWKITALKVAKDGSAKDRNELTASALRMSFQTERPVFPYREPDAPDAVSALNAKSRLLRVYFVSDARYDGSTWSGKAAWSGQLTADQRKQLLTALRLPEATGPAKFFLTEFEDNWPYRKATEDVYFAKSADQREFKRQPIVEYGAAPFPTDVTLVAVFGVIAGPPVLRRLRRHLAAS